jgi:hypothetical protein
MSIQNKVSKKLPEYIFTKVISYSRKKYKSRIGKGSTYNKFMLRNAQHMPIDEVENLVKQGMTQMLNKVTSSNLEIMNVEITKILDLMKDLTKENKQKIHKLLLSLLLNKSIHEHIFSKLYAKILDNMCNQIKIDYCEYLEQLFLDIKNTNKHSNFSKDYNTFCDQLKSKDNYIGLFVFIGELFKQNMLEFVLVKKYLMILMNNIMKDKDNALQIEINAHCIKNLLFKCECKKLYTVVYDKFKIMQNDKKYKHKFRFILMDICEKYETYI